MERTRQQMLDAVQTELGQAAVSMGTDYVDFVDPATGCTVLGIAVTGGDTAVGTAACLMYYASEAVRDDKDLRRAVMIELAASKVHIGRRRIIYFPALLWDGDPVFGIDDQGK